MSRFLASLLRQLPPETRAEVKELFALGNEFGNREFLGRTHEVLCSDSSQSVLVPFEIFFVVVKSLRHNLFDVCLCDDTLDLSQAVPPESEVASVCEWI